MKLIILAAVAGLLAVPANACDMHGMFGGGDDGYGPRSWLTDEELELQRKQAIAAARAALVARFRGLAGPEAQSAETKPTTEQPQVAAVSEPGNRRP